VNPPPERPSPLGIEFILPVVGFVLVAPIGALALPVAALTGMAASRAKEAAFLTILAAFFAGWWLLGLGSPPQQILRAAVTMGTVAFVVLTVATRMSVIHRSLFATWMAALAIFMLMVATRGDWSEIQWWISSETGTARMVLLGTSALLARITSIGPGTLAGLEQWADRLPDLAGVLFPGFVALQVLGGLVIASVVVHRIGISVGEAPGRFREFTFSVHLGWIAGIAAAMVMWGPNGPLWVAAVNVSMVMAVLYAARGAAVVRAFWPLQGIKSWLSGLAVILLALVLWRVVVMGLIVGGVGDASFDTRHRWLKKG
jgi:hypothetical protein